MEDKILTNIDNLNEMSRHFKTLMEVNDKLLIEINEKTKLINELQNNIREEEDNSNRVSLLKAAHREIADKDIKIKELEQKLCSSINKSKVNVDVKVEELDGHNKKAKVDETRRFTVEGMIFTDGACSNNGKPNAKAGIGVYFGDGDKRNVSKRITGNQTNNVAELSAILEAFNICKDIASNIKIYTDSEYSINALTIWGEKHHKKNWEPVGVKHPLKNLELIKEGYYFIKEHTNVTLHHIKAHTGKGDILSLGNDAADKLATESLNQPDIEDDGSGVSLWLPDGAGADMDEKVSDMEEKESDIEEKGSDMEDNTDESSSDTEESNNYVAFNYNNGKYCYKTNVNSIQCYYKLVNDDIGERVGKMRIMKVKKVEHYLFEDINDGKLYIYNKDKKNILGERIGEKVPGKEKGKTKNKLY
jgi:ribonuclease HI